MMLRRIVLTLSLMIFPALGLARPATALVAEPQPARVAAEADFYPRIASYQPSFIGWVYGEDPHATFQISIQYPFLPFEVFGANSTTAFVGYRSGFFVAYTGRYDLYFNRYSSPTVTREHNPGMYFDFNRCFDLPWIASLGYFHASNGQVVDTREQYLAIPAHAQDFVSRGWDYLLAGTSYTIPWPNGPNPKPLISYRSKRPPAQDVQHPPPEDLPNLTLGWQGFYFMNQQGFGAAGKEESIFWEEVSGQPRRSDFDGIRVSLVFQNASYRLADTLRTGYTGFNLTNDLSLTFKVGTWLPLSIQWHAGYGPDLSAYHIFSHYWALGCEF